MARCNRSSRNVPLSLTHTHTLHAIVWKFNPQKHTYNRQRAAEKPGTGLFRGYMLQNLLLFLVAVCLCVFKLEAGILIIAAIWALIPYIGCSQPNTSISNTHSISLYLLKRLSSSSTYWILRVNGLYVDILWTAFNPLQSSLFIHSNGISRSWHWFTQILKLALP